MRYFVRSRGKVCDPTYPPLPLRRASIPSGRFIVSRKQIVVELSTIPPKQTLSFSHASAYTLNWDCIFLPSQIFPRFSAARLRILRSRIARSHTKVQNPTKKWPHKPRWASTQRVAMQSLNHSLTTSAHASRNSSTKSTTRPGLSRALSSSSLPHRLADPFWPRRRYSDDNFEYRHVALPKAMLKVIPKDYFDTAKGTLKLLHEREWRSMGITQVRKTRFGATRGWGRDRKLERLANTGATESRLGTLRGSRTRTAHSAFQVRLRCTIPRWPPADQEFTGDHSTSSLQLT